MSAYLATVVVGMAAVTFGVRLALFALGERVRFTPRLRRALAYVPVAVLSAITLPMVLLPDGGHWQLDWRNPWLAGTLASGVLALRVRSLLAAIVGGMAVYLLWRWQLG
ncbi:branched-chain amino acid transport protein AzlD [mine drainage metagenome]|uniref:Branched-chain amino acid transport protein AzlD n=1 Tax=mine drainage metagenome TaxID=410659 RepID=A0A1J5Q694_9ZZZZ